MSFCPLLSTADKKVDCQAECEWFTRLQDGSTQCAVNYISDCCDHLAVLDSIDGSVGFISDEIPYLKRR